METSKGSTVFVFGAGFSKAFVPEMPLLCDHWALPEIFNNKNLKTLSDYSCEASNAGKLNIELLMTRLQNAMPYDDYEDNALFQVAYSQLKKSIQQRIERAKENSSRDYVEELQELAKYCLNEKISCVTFNYDDIFDEMLFSLNHLENYSASQPHWNPDGGYGFYCPLSSTLVDTSSRYMDKNDVLLLKLHGSMNWRVKRGRQSPYGLDAVVHHEQWGDLKHDIGFQSHQEKVNLDAIPRHLEPEPFIVPPVLTKENLSVQPVLRVVWSLAFDILKEAAKVVFVGYSFPTTDLAARFMFQEAFGKKCLPEIQVVNYVDQNDPKMESTKKQIINQYKESLPNVRFNPKHFQFNGAKEWISELLGTEVTKKY